jgi:tRNA(Ile)-lysidine synthase
MVLKQFESGITQYKLFTKKDSLLLAMSGGPDSVVLAHLLKEAGYNFSIAHCNFQLRGIDSTKDEIFCRQLAEKMNVRYYTTTFNTRAYAKTHKLSIQLAARNLRYEWFNTLLKEHKITYLVTAHHAGDTVETILINLLRGTGIRGVKGISRKNGAIVRPLLDFSKQEILNFVKEKKIAFRLDKSNLDDKYERNFLRLKVIPALKKINPSLEVTFAENSVRFAQEAGLLDELLSTKQKQLVAVKGDSLTIHLGKLNKEIYRETILHHILGPFGFNAAMLASILNSVDSGRATGKMFYTASHRLTINRSEMPVEPLSPKSKKAIVIHSMDELRHNQFFRVKTVKKFTLPAASELLLNPAQLIFPLVVRHKATGDKFKPFGMKGFKLLSDYMREEKMSAFEKEKCRLLVNGNGEIIWVIGHRSDERYRVDKNNTEFLHLTICE